MRMLTVFIGLFAFAASAGAQDVTWRKDVQPIIAAGGKPGNMYAFLGADDAERAKNLQTIKAWLGEGAWNLNRWQKRGDTPGISKEQLEKIKAKY